MGDIKNKKLIHIKGWLFLLTGLMASGGIILETFNLKIIFLLIIAIWSFCRFYYFLFYVIEKYTDPEFKFDGLYSLVKYYIKLKKK